MTDYRKLVEALRLCQFGECGCGKCYYKELKGDWCTEDNHPEFFDCDDKLKLDAAAAIEELEKELGIWAARSFEGKIGSMALINLNLRMEISKLQAQLPKRGKWVRVEDGDSWHYECSRCRERPLYSLYGDIVLSGTCPTCGAKMIGEQNVE